ncbi:hypothetical protein [Streptomyces sp. NPDC021020]|uniref:hypothetical protein n=1 Tax=Streptomyces sp. NPDC021020 TaxID=3365109 RepID=UPI00379DDDE8
MLSRLLAHLRAAARPLFGLELCVTPRIPAPAEQPGPPLLVFARHAGPGDSSLRRHGRLRKAARAARMHYVLPPRDAGVLAALEAAPTADAIFVAHSGLDVIDSVRSAWTGIPLHQPVQAHWWRVRSGDVPRTREARSEWLLTQWTRVDAWIATRAAPGTTHV